MPLNCRRREMSIGPPRNHRKDASDPNLRALLNRPLHAIKFENGKNKSDLRRSLHPAFVTRKIPKEKLNPIRRDGSNRTSANRRPSSNVKFLADLCAQHTSKMKSMLANQSSRIPGDLISNPPSATHE